MHFVTVEGKTLKQALKPLVDTVDRRSTIPILGCVKLSLSAAGLRLEATDLDIVASTEIDVIDGDRAGGWALCLPAHGLAAIARVAGAMPVRIEPGETATITLGDGDCVYTLAGQPDGDFPEIAFARGDAIERFGNGRLVGLLDKLRGFISSEETRYYLNGICWQRGAFGSRFVATDGHRLALCGYDGEAQDDAASWIIPRKAVELLTRHCAGLDVTACRASDGKLGMVFVSDRLTLSTKLIDGTYPDIDKVVTPAVANAGAFTLALKRAETLAAIERLSVFGRDIGRAVKFDVCDGRLDLSRAGESGGARVRTSVIWPPGLTCFGANGVYFSDMVQGCDGDVTLGLGNAGDPMLIRDADPAMTRILMPMRV